MQGVRHIDIKTLVKYKSWADDVFYDVLSRLPEYELSKNRPMLFGNIMSLLNHVYAMDIVWRANLEGVAHNLQTRNPKDVPPIDILRDNQAQVNSWFEDYADQLSARQLDEEIEFIFIGGDVGKMQRSEVIHHVINHASYHRGHIEGVLYQMSVEPPTTDIPVFLKNHLLSG